ncbi:8904_t:CDS:10 [Entrophospora sp. SA101]|nr:8904_t:CDS:10 [Entrophospora sp. SA101]
MQSTTPLSPTIKPIIMGNDPSIGNANFWNELFLLKVNSSYLSKCFSEFSQDHLLSIKTLCIILKGIFSKKFNNFSFEVINLLTGLDNANITFSKLITSIKYLLIKGESDEIRNQTLKLAIILLISVSLSSESSNISYDAAILLGILANYKKREFKNPYLIKISEIKDDKIFGALIKVIGLICSKCRNQYIEIQDDDYENTQKLTVSSVLSYISIMPWNNPITNTITSTISNTIATTSNIATTISNTITNTNTISSTTSGNTNNNTQQNANDNNNQIQQNEAYKEFINLPSSNVAILLIFFDIINNNHKFIEFISKNQKDNKKSNNKNDDDNDDSQQHQELFCDFLSFLSYLFQHNRTQRTFKYIKLSLFILTIIIEDDKNAKFIFEDTKLFKIRLCKQKKPILPEVKSSRPIVCFILDICVGFLIHNMRRKLQSDLYSLTLGIIHRIIFQLKTNKIRLDYHWVELWNSLINLLKFIKSNIDYFEDKSVIIKEVLMLVIDIINLSISYGDQFFNEALSYDNLFYEIIRNKETFENLNGLAIITKNYDSLELVTNKRIEQLPSYNEIPYHVSFLRQVLREVVKDFKENYFF